MSEKITRPRKPKEMNVFNMKADHFRMNAEEKFIFQKMRELFKQLRELSSEDRRDSLLTLSLIMNSIFKTNEETKLIPHIEENLLKLNNKVVEFEGFVNSSRYDLYQDVLLYDFKIESEKIPFLLCSQLVLKSDFDIYQEQKNGTLETIIIEDELGLQKFYLVGRGLLKYKKGEDPTVDISRQYALSLV